MTVTVRLFASYADRLGRNEMELELADGATVADALHFISVLPGGNSLPVSPLVAVNRTYARLDSPLGGGDEVAFIPPVAGG